MAAEEVKENFGRVTGPVPRQAAEKSPIVEMPIFSDLNSCHDGSCLRNLTVNVSASFFFFFVIL